MQLWHLFSDCDIVGFSAPVNMEKASSENQKCEAQTDPTLVEHSLKNRNVWNLQLRPPSLYYIQYKSTSLLINAALINSPLLVRQALPVQTASGIH